MADISALGISITVTGADKATSELERLTKAANDVSPAVDRVNKETKKGGDGIRKMGDDAKKTEGALGGLARQARSLGGVLAAAFSIRAIAQYADAWSDMQSRVGAAVRDMDAAPQLMQRLVDIANASYSPLAQTVEIYSRNVTVLAEMGRSAGEAADFTEALNNALVITATRGERAASVQNALSKAMAVGKIDAQGLETVLANGGAVAEALAAELGTTVNGLRKMSSEGKITSDVIANSLIKRFDELRARAEEMPATMEDGIVRIKNNFIQLIGTLDQTYGVSERIAEVFLWIADNMREIAALTAIAAASWVVYQAGVAAAALAQAIMNSTMGIYLALVRLAYREVGLLAAAHTLLAGATAGAASAFRVFAAAMLANPFGLIIASIAAVTALLYANRDAQVEVGNETIRLGDVFLGIWELVNRAVEFAQTLFTEGWQAAFASISPALAAIGGMFDRVFTYIGNMVRNTINTFVGLFVGLGAAARAIFSDESVSGAFSAAQGRDYVGAAGASIRQGILDLADLGKTARGTAIATKEAASAGSRLAVATDAASKASKAKAAALTEEQKSLQRRNDETERFISNLEEEIAKIGLSDQALRAYEIAKARDVAVTEQQRQKIDDLSAARERALKIEEDKDVEEKRLKFMSDFTKGANEQIAALERQQVALGLSGVALDEYLFTTEALARADAEGIELKKADILVIQERARVYAQTKGVFDQQIEAQKAFDDNLRFSQRTVKGFFMSWSDGIREGKNIFKSFADSVIQSINRIFDRLLETQLDNLFGIGGGGGGLGNLFGLLGGGGSSINAASQNLIANNPAIFANGGAFDNGGIQRFAKGGSFTNSVVSTPTLFRFANGGALGEMGEAGPEAIMPLKRGANGELGVQLHGGGGSPQQVQVQIVDTTGLFVTRVNGQIATSAPIIIDQSSKTAQRDIAQRQTRRVA